MAGYRTPIAHGTLSSVQVLRGTAALCVVLAHIPFIGIGSFGVDIFFVTSGFIICHIAPAERRFFFLYRICRVVPLYWIATFAVCLIASRFPWLIGSTDTDTASVLKSIFFIPYNRENGQPMPVLGVGWTLNFEMLFYAVFAACLRCCKTRIAPIACGALLLAVAILGRFVNLPMPWSFWTLPYPAEFAAGIGAFYLLRIAGERLKRIPLAILAAISIGGLIVLFTAALIHPHLRVLSIIIPCAFCIFVSTVLTEGRWRIPALAVLIGDASYSLYLLHPFVIAAAQKTMDPMVSSTPGSFLAALIAIFCALVVAHLSLRLFERPSNKALRKLIANRTMTANRASPRLDGFAAPGRAATLRAVPVAIAGISPYSVSNGRPTR